nr:aaa-atpase [Quercus suber]
MDKHIELSYCCFEAFKVLAKNYLDVDSHQLFATIGHLFEETNMTPADVAENLMPKSLNEDVETVTCQKTCLKNLIEALERAKEEARKKAKEDVRLKAEKEEKEKQEAILRLVLKGDHLYILAIGMPVQGQSTDEPTPVGDLEEAFVSSIPLVNDH